MPSHSPGMHPERKILGPERLFDPRNFVPPLEPIYGPRAWDNTSEVGPRDACGRCGGSVRADGIFCAGCHRVARTNQAKLTSERRCDPKPEAKAPKAKARPANETAARKKAADLADKRARKTARDRRRFEQAIARFRADPAVRAWATEQDLTLKAIA